MAGRRESGNAGPDRDFSQAEAQGVTKIYGRHRALSKVSLTVTEGRVTALLGPQRRRKNYPALLFSTLSKPSTGTMHFGDLPPERAKEARGRIGLLSHAALTYGDLSAVENVTFLVGFTAPINLGSKPKGCWWSLV